MAKYSSPSKFVYKLLYYTYGVYYKAKNKVKVAPDSRFIKGLKGPALVMSTHTSFFDFIHIGYALYPTVPVFVANRLYSQVKPTCSLMKWIKIIPKTLFYKDGETIRRIYEAIKHNEVVAMMPEARLSSSGASFPVASGTAALVKKLGVDVYRVHTEGAYYSHPKWNTCKRKTNLKVTVQKIFFKDELEDLSTDEVEQILNQKMQYRDDRALMPLRKCKDRTKGLDGLLYLCPNCMQQFTLSTEDNKVKCRSCGYEVYMDKNCLFTSGHFETVADWYDFQNQSLKKEMEVCGLNLSMPVIFKRADTKKKKLLQKGEGVCSLDKDRFVFEGIVDGEQKKYDIVTSKIEGLPYSCGKKIDLVIGGQLVFLYPTQNPLQCSKWSMAIDILRQERDQLRRENSIVKK